MTVVGGIDDPPQIARLAEARVLLWLTVEMSRPPPSTKVSFENGMWIVRIERPGGKLQEYHCASEAQAKALVESLEKAPAY